MVVFLCIPWRHASFCVTHRLTLSESRCGKLIPRIPKARPHSDSIAPYMSHAGYTGPELAVAALGLVQSTNVVQREIAFDAAGPRICVGASACSRAGLRPFS